MVSFQKSEYHDLFILTSRKRQTAENKYDLPAAMLAGRAGKHPFGEMPHAVGEAKGPCFPVSEQGAFVASELDPIRGTTRG